MSATASTFEYDYELEDDFEYQRQLDKRHVDEDDFPPERPNRRNTFDPFEDEDDDLLP